MKSILKTSEEVYTAKEAGEAIFNARVVYRDDKGVESFHSAEPMTLNIVERQAIAFDVAEARSLFAYLVRQFTQEYMVRKRSLEESGWRSLPQIADNARIPRSTLYGDNGRYGRPLHELLSRGLIEERVFAERKGRTGETVKFRVPYGREPVRRFVIEASWRRSSR